MLRNFGTVCHIMVSHTPSFSPMSQRSFSCVSQCSISKIGEATQLWMRGGSIFTNKLKSDVFKDDLCSSVTLEPFVTSSQIKYPRFAQCLTVLWWIAQLSVSKIRETADVWTWGCPSKSNVSKHDLRCSVTFEPFVICWRVTHRHLAPCLTVLFRVSRNALSQKLVKLHNFECEVGRFSQTSWNLTFWRTIFVAA